MTPPPLIRPARPQDVPQILKMVGQLAAHHGDVPTLTAEALQRDLFGDPPWICALVAESGEDLVGYAVMCGLIQLQFGARGMDLHHLFTDAARRGEGIGRRLVEACRREAMARSCRVLTVGTHPDNHAAQAFYADLGFERRDSHPPRFTLRLDP
ncbi:GNAT family N-acetyltransferase [Pseudooceanicola sp. CBS1P-1]|uniref:GNAT family N-acetyltransferase n=1 Tax=Pseudooceanicola albus TaxID=2692189 RepID=A0A6L7G5D7_9RHOB|nr:MULTISPECIES: GNAT family N-acetyltransferase [Pseudooceanicola]MBT9385138.1 GNAT family N-acetyltransferase [Pseudooceanicola endophyticus]MXN18570.1 GNAT family N-acetyltransferase [Pseudooceanicola albus]